MIVSLIFRLSDFMFNTFFVFEKRVLFVKVYRIDFLIEYVYDTVIYPVKGEIQGINFPGSLFYFFKRYGINFLRSFLFFRLSIVYHFFLFVGVAEFPPGEVMRSFPLSGDLFFLSQGETATLYSLLPLLFLPKG